MKKIILAFTLFFSATTVFTSCDTLQQVASQAASGMLTNDEVGTGLKSALDIGISRGVDVLSQKGGYFSSAYKILLPEEARRITEKLKFIPGFNKVEDILLEKINSGAEDAAAKAKPIFINAIKQMTFNDVMGILMGDKNGATEYLKRSTYQQLYSEFNPVIITSLDKFEARKYWGDAVNAYNKIPLITKANPSLDEYVTKKALDGLFSMVEEKERGIRGNIGERTTELLRRVFAKQDPK